MRGGGITKPFSPVLEDVILLSWGKNTVLMKSLTFLKAILSHSEHGPD